MKTFLFGFDNEHPAECAQELRRHHIDAVVMGAPTPETAAALSSEEIELYLSCGAYRVNESNGLPAIDYIGKPQPWFHSGCPNDRANAERLLDEVLMRAKAFPSVRGILVDGARFASFASIEGIEPFFTCFCPACMKVMRSLGIDGEAVRASVERLAATRIVSEKDEALLQQWFAFRESCIQQYMDHFADRVHQLRDGLMAGAFIFPPSLGRFVGQTAAACRSLDIVSHMLYRSYPHEFGVACLGHEWAAMADAFGAQLQPFSGSSLTDSRCARQLLRDGFTPEWVGHEVTEARVSCLPHQKLWPIIQIEDDFITETARCAFKAGADGVGYFSYGDAPLP